MTSQEQPPMDRRDVPRYAVTEGAHYLHLPPATLRAWVFGRAFPRVSGEGFFEPLIEPASSASPPLSFHNLVEAHVLRSLRCQHQVQMRHVRTALRVAEVQFGIQRLLLSRQLLAAPGEIFLDSLQGLVNLNRAGQVALRAYWEAHLARVEWAEDMRPVRLYPFVEQSVGGRNAPRPIVIDPSVAFGRPVLASQGITTGAIVRRVNAGEDLAIIAADYDIEVNEVEQAVLYEQRVA